MLLLLLLCAQLVVVFFRRRRSIPLWIIRTDWCCTREEEEGTNDVDKGDARKEDMVVFMRAMVFFFFSLSLFLSLCVLRVRVTMTFIGWHIIPFDKLFPVARVI